MPLTDTKIKNAKPKDKPYSLPDGNGLYLEIRPTGAKFWRYRFWLHEFLFSHSFHFPILR
ncbi:Arm DNA-binding domain-containing protein [Xenorhabdus bovienii]|uniref:Integrase DNA-binding domain-containing protein n=1 Tax=Xenorhabdus bovienii str. feltiae Moldova TaxID=1398200 RepID=A0A077NUI8_XENBV|nr:hypothetical protein XBFM1_2740016 [Xenorhabdus bovienii str. feltiae Moldova]